MQHLDPPMTPKAFLDFVFKAMIQRLGTSEKDNVDPDYPPDGVTDDTACYAEKRAAYLRFFVEHYERLFGTYQQLEDDASKALFIDLILFRILGYEHVRLSSNNAVYWLAKRGTLLIRAGTSPLDSLPGAQNLAHFELNVEGRGIQLECLRANIFFSFFLRQYYFTRNAVSICPTEGEHVIDAGACFGDTALGFAHAVGASGCVHAFDIVDAHLRTIRYNIGQNSDLTNIIVHPVALGDSDHAGSIATSNVNPGFSVERAETTVPMRSVDSLTSDGLVEQVDFIKMDVEGHELQILRGAERSIRRFRPKLAISLYHRSDDYFRIPEYIQRLGVHYRMYLENYTISDGETVLYCTASAR